MKKLKKIFILELLLFFILSSNCYATDQQISQDEILESQQNSLNISKFIEEANKYTENVFDDISIEELFNSAITGKIDNTSIWKKIINLIGKEIVDCLNVLGSIIIIIVIHSILRSISEGLENKSISQITYYVQYILIVTLIMTNFSDIIQMVRTSIESLVGFMNSLIPILITLMLTTGNIASARSIRTYNIVHHHFYWKFHNSSINTIYTYINSTWNCVKSI